ncbi:MAG: cupin domain-containing protein [Myxococcales bacterium]|nr:cupin domain-containing protein [Myxococcales bacterium]
MVDREAQRLTNELDPEAAKLVELLGLAPHPEGGWFRETWRSPLVLGGLPHGAPRSASTSIYFLLPAGAFSALHRVASDEVWHHYDGDPLELHVLEGRVHQTFILGRDLARGQRPQHVVPAGAWQAAVPLGPRWALCGCTVSPGFDFADFEMPSREEMLQLLPDHVEIVKRLTRETAPAAEPIEP